MLRRTVLLALCALLLAAIALAPAANAKPAAGWSWSAKGALKGLGGSADSLSCASTSLCAIAGGPNVFTTGSWSAKAAAWKRTRLAQDDPSILGGSNIMTEVECPSAAGCVATDYYSRAYTSTTALAASVGAWSQSKLPFGTYVGITALGCADAGLCAAFDTGGLALATVDALAPGSAWKATQVSTVLNASLYEISCGGNLCAGVQASGAVYVAPDARGASADWKVLTISTKRAPLNTIDCPTAKLCVAGGYGGALRVSVNPVAKASWKSVRIPGATQVDHVRCASAKLCFATAGSRVFVSTAPARAGSWKLTLDTKGTILSDLSCPTPSQCVLVDVGGKIWTGRRA